MSSQAFLAVQTLGSGSCGNMAVIRAPNTTIILDMGLRSGKATGLALDTARVTSEEITAVLVSHSHVDHLNKACLAYFAKHNVKLLMGPETAAYALQMVRTHGITPPQVLTIFDGATYLAGELEVTPFIVQHDVPTFGFSFVLRAQGKTKKVAVATDLGCAPEHLVQYFADADIILIEANYNEQLLQQSPRHPLDKARVQSPFGHLSNKDAGRFLRLVLSESRKPADFVSLVHLSQDHNDPAIAISEVRAILGPLASKARHLCAAPRQKPGVFMRV